MTGWTPLYHQIVASSIWGAPDHVRLAWITLLAICNKDGIAPVTAGGLARLANISIENAADALKVLSEPDQDTLTQEHEGRRIERVDNGWRLLNWQKYRELTKKQILREQNRIAQAKYRATKVSTAGQQVSEDVNDSQKQPEPPSDSGVQQLLSELMLLYGRDHNRRPTYSEEREAFAIAQRPAWRLELGALITYRGQLVRTGEGRYFPQSMDRLLATWDETLDRANSKQQTKPRSIADKDLDCVLQQEDIPDPPGL